MSQITPSPQRPGPRRPLTGPPSADVNSWPLLGRIEREQLKHLATALETSVIALVPEALPFEQRLVQRKQPVAQIIQCFDFALSSAHRDRSPVCSCRQRSASYFCAKGAASGA